jgi:hypothetical protein
VSTHITGPKCLSGSKANVQLDLIDFLLLRIGEESNVCAHYGENVGVPLTCYLRDIVVPVPRQDLDF